MFGTLRPHVIAGKFDRIGLGKSAWFARGEFECVGRIAGHLARSAGFSPIRDIWRYTLNSGWLLGALAVKSFYSGAPLVSPKPWPEARQRAISTPTKV